MRYRILILLAVILFAYAPLADAGTLGTSKKAAIIEQIQTLIKEVEALKKQLASSQTTTKPALTEFAYKTKFYTGKYESIYNVDRDILIAPPRELVREGDQLLWNTFVDIAGEEFIEENISEFRVYNNMGSEVSAFVEKKPDDTWIISVNREGEKMDDMYRDSAIVELLLHEYAHIVFFQNAHIEEEYTRTFWKGTKKASYDTNPSFFVTEYAATSPTEDMMESFVHFVIHDKPVDAAVKYNKTRFFYNFPQLVTLRQELRDSDLF